MKSTRTLAFRICPILHKHSHQTSERSGHLSLVNKHKNEVEERDDVVEPVKKPVLDYRGEKANCAVYGSGLARTGALGQEKLVTKPGSSSCMNRPFRIAYLNTKRIRRVSAGLGFSLFASPSHLYGSGLNNFGQLAGPLPKDDNELHSLVGTSDGVYAFGDNAHGQCGQNPKEFPQVIKCSVNAGLPKVAIPDQSEVKQVHCMLDSSFVLTRNGDLYSFGLSTDGQLGTGCMDVESVPTKVPLPPIRLIAGSTDTAMAVDYEGNLYMWGQCEYNQLSEFTDEQQLAVPLKVPFKFDSPIRSAHSTATSCIVSTEKGVVYTWGSMILGSGPTLTDSTRPVELSPNLFGDTRGNNSKVRRVFGGNTSMAAINEANQLFVWGANRHSSLALGHDNDQLFPLQVSVPTSVISVALGQTHTIILASHTSR